MVKVPKKVSDRIKTRVSAFRQIALGHRERGVSEADTVTLVKDVLADVFGYDKYLELTSEQQIRGTFCDLAVKIDGTTRFLIEVKAAGTQLNEGHLRQVVNYGAQHGIEWLVLTNSIDWQIFRLRFAQPIEFDLVAEIDFLTVDPAKDEDLSKLFLLCREGLEQEAMTRFHRHGQQLNRFTLAQVIQSEPVLKTIRAQFRRLFPGLKLKEELLRQMLKNEILRADLTEGEKAADAAKLVAKTDKKLARKKAKLASAEGNSTSGEDSVLPDAMAATSPEETGTLAVDARDQEGS